VVVDQQYALAFVGTIFSWPLINKFGRRTIYLSGLMGIFVSLLIVGFISLGPASDSGISWAIGGFLLVFTFIYDSTVGPLTCKSKRILDRCLLIHRRHCAGNTLISLASQDYRPRAKRLQYHMYLDRSHYSVHVEHHSLELGVSFFAYSVGLALTASVLKRLSSGLEVRHFA
jgi:hypothetical protein